ncbi:hypothetical protein F5883DRAFT_184255 [Diaporthe sp. PMI_573]|nr:hypothetical protein F5883DRAFT_184255 [Diaporthaceae sp. PMI_573]
MDRNLESPSAGISAANLPNELLDPQTSLFGLLERDHTPERTGLDNEHEARESEINARLRHEKDYFISSLNQTFQKMQEAVVKMLNSTVANQVHLHLERDKLRRNSEEGKRMANVLKMVTDVICNSTAEQNMTLGSLATTIDGFPGTGTLHQAHSPHPHRSDTTLSNGVARVGTVPRSPILQPPAPTPTSDSLCSETHPREQLISDNRASQQKPGTALTPATLPSQAKRTRTDLPDESTTITTKRQRVNHLAAEQTHTDNSVENTANREITFDMVFQDGQAKYKHKIFELKEGSGDWYVVKCDKHETRFGFKNPVRGAATHINSPCHGNLQRTNDLAIRECGFLVTDCTAELAQANNKMFEDALRGKYKILGQSNTKVANNQRGRPRKRQGNPRKTKADDRCSNLTNCVGSSEKLADCITIPLASEPRMDEEVANTQGPGGLHERSAPRKQGADHVVIAPASELQCSDTESLRVTGGTPPRNPGITDSGLSSGYAAAANALLQLREGTLDANGYHLREECPATR